MTNIMRARIWQDGYGRCLCIFLGVTLMSALMPSTNGGSTSENNQKLAEELKKAMNLSAEPCEDFYQYSCGLWIDNHTPIPADKISYNRFQELNDQLMKNLKGLLEAPVNGSDTNTTKKAKNLYQSCMNEDKLEELGTQPLLDLIDSFGFSWPLISPDSFDPSLLKLESLLPKLGLVGVNPLMKFAVDSDLKNSSVNIGYIDRGSFGLSRENLLKGRTSPEVLAYEHLKRKQVEKVLGLKLTCPVKEDIAAIVDFEIELANMTASPTERRDTEKIYKKMTFGDLQKNHSKIDWLEFVNNILLPAGIELDADSEVTVAEEKYHDDMIDLYKTTNKTIVANYILMLVINSFYGKLHKEIRDLYGPLRKILTGQKESKPRWEDCVISTRGFMKEAVGQLYVKHFFSQSAKDEVLALIKYLQSAMEQMINEVPWMDNSTRIKALEKASTMGFDIGYPDYQFNETVIETFFENVNHHQERFFQNVLDQKHSNTIENSKKLNKPVDKNRWLWTAAKVNAGYNPSKNRMIFPAGILQPPFFGENQLTSMNFGAIGMVIGHEITHGFDDEGRKYNKEGNLVDWWSKFAVDEFENLTKCFVEEYSKQVVFGENVNGELTQGENIADIGGLKAAFIGYKKWLENHTQEQTPLPGLSFTNEELFFIQYGQVFCGLIREEAQKQYLKVDPHSPGVVRINMGVSHSPDFAKAFNCSETSPMNPKKKCVLW